MDITEVRISPVGGRDDKLRAFCSVTFDDCFVVRDIRLIEGNKGLFIAMPSRKLTIRCSRCHYKNVVRSQYCNECGTAIPRALSDEVEQGRTKLHADIAHPILTSFREVIQEEVLDAYERHLDEMDGQESRPRGREPVLASATEEPEGRRAPGKPVRGPAHDPDRGEAASVGGDSNDESADESDDQSNVEVESSEAESSEASFLGKEEQNEDDSERDSSEDDDSKQTMPPPDDNFSSGLF
ncbi:MAG: SpoVG family protein [Planctomycetota bacterium]|nr:SpoVG family protein [Planctomycetota bacterium]